MNGFMKPYQLERIKNLYKPGTRIALDSMEDPYVPIPSGTKGTVTVVDSIGTLHVDWDNGRKLGVVPNEDSFHIIKEKENTIKVLVVEPMKEPYTKEIQNEYEAMQKVVGGYIEYVQLDDACHLYCNEEGKIDGLVGNRKMDFGDVICGTFFICASDSEGNDKSLDSIQIEKFSERFKELENYKGIDFSNPIVTITTYDSSEEMLNSITGLHDDDFER